MGAIILRWNRRLDIAVKQRTSDLVLANEQLRQRTDELASANMEIASQAEVQRDLFNITAHELRTPTQSILANAELMHDALQTSDRHIRDHLFAAIHIIGAAPEPCGGAGLPSSRTPSCQISHPRPIETLRGFRSSSRTYSTS